MSGRLACARLILVLAVAVAAMAHVAWWTLTGCCCDYSNVCEHGRVLLR